jgi:hypothetical protein
MIFFVRCTEKLPIGCRRGVFYNGKRGLLKEGTILPCCGRGGYEGSVWPSPRRDFREDIPLYG